jgi:small-conductance mechanosensitive channel
MDQLASLWGPTSSLFWVRAAWAALVLLLFLWLAQVASRGTRRGLTRAGAQVNAILFVTRISRLGIQVLGVVVGLAILGVELSALAAFLGLATVAISVSLQDMIRNLLAGLYLLIERPFQVGDTIDVGGQQGVVEDVGMRTTILRGAEGNRIIVPNLVMFTSIITQKNQSPEQAHQVETSHRHTD